MPDDPYATLISTFKVLYRFLDTQTYDESTESPPTNIDADITYSDFQVYVGIADDELTSLLNTNSIAESFLTDSQYNALICHLVADHFEEGNPDWNFRSQSQAPGVSFSRGQDTGPREAFNKLFNGIVRANSLGSVTCGRGASTELTRIKDSANYPRRWKRTLIPAYDHFEGGFDESSVDDSGQEDNSNSYSEWS